MPIRIILQHVADGRYNVILQVGWFSSAAKRIVRRADLSEVENLLWSLSNASEVEISGKTYPISSADISVITSDMAITNLNFGS